MLCPQCGNRVEEDKPFCRFCGARLTAPAAPAPGGAPPPATATPPTPPPQVSPGGWVPQPTAPPQAWSGPQSPPQEPSPHAWAGPRSAPPLTWEAPQSAPPRRPSRVGLTVVIVAGVLIIAAALVVAVLLVGRGEEPTTNTSAVVTVTSAPESTLPPTGTSTLPGTGTTATIPGFDPGGTATTGAGADTSAYAASLASLDAALVFADERMPQLAEQINATAPDVPEEIYYELEGLLADLETARSDLGRYQPPPEYEEADRLIFEATDAQEFRIDQTMQGIDALWGSGDVAAGSAYFSEGRAARDDYRRLYAEYQAALP